MPAKLLIRLPADPALPVQWLAVDANGHPEGAVERGPLESALPACAGRQVIGLLSGLDVLLLSARIPTQSRQKLARAIPYALEEQVADDLDDLHFTAGRRDEQERLAVAVVGKQRLQEWLDDCATVGLELEQVQPELLALPFEADDWTLLIEGNQFLLRTGAQSGYAGDVDNVLPLLQATLEEASAEERQPQQLHVYGQPPAELNSLGLDCTQRDAPEPLRVFASGLDPRNSIDLRSGAFARKRSGGAGWGRWQVAAGLLAAWVLIDTSAAYLQQWRLSNQVAALNSQIEQTYQEAFPGAGRLINPRQQVETRMRALRSTGSTEIGLLDMLERAGPIIKADSGVKLSVLTYRNGELDLEFHANNLQDVDKLKQLLDNVEGLEADVRTARAEGERVLGRLRIGVSA